MLKNVVVQIVTVCTHYAKTVVLLTVALAGLSIWYTAENFALNTDISKLISPALDWRQREIAYEKAFPGGHESIIAVIEAPTAELTTLATRELQAKLEGRTDQFRLVENIAGSPFFQHNGLLFLPTAEVKETTEKLASGEPLIGSLATDPSLRGLTEALTTVLAGLKRGEIKIDDVAKPFNKFSDTIDSVLSKGTATFSWRELANGGPLPTSDLRGFLRVRPVLDFNALEPGRAAENTIRESVSELGLAEKYQARVRLTGPVAIANDEFGSTQEGIVLNSIITCVIVLFILWMALHSPKIIAAVSIALMLGLAITTAVGLLLAGAFNPISVAFAVLFVGLGVDFGIQFSIRYRTERYEVDDLYHALAKAAENSAVPLSLAAVATALGFLSFLPTAYQGVSELGKIAGAGMLIAFLGSITVLPALLVLFNPPGEKDELGYAFMAPVDAFMERYRIAIVALTLGVAIAGLPLLYYLQFDFNPMNLRSAKVESVATYLDIRRDPQSGASAIDVIAPSRQAAVQVEERLRKVPEADQVTSIDFFVPKDQPAKLAAIKKAAEVLGPTFKEAKLERPTDAENVEALKDAGTGLKQAAAGKTGSGADAMNRLAGTVTKLAQSSEAQRNEAQNVFIVPLRVALEGISNSLLAKPITFETLPKEIVSDWMTSDGRTRVQVTPKGDPNDNETLRQFARAVLAVEPTAIGGPISILEAGNTISHAFIQAGLWALCSIALLLWVVLRRIGDVLLTLVPLILAGALTLEICVLLGIAMNFANIVALPLLLGVGVAFKIYYVVAWRAGSTNLLQSSLTRAIFWSALTTATAFGSLWFSSHPGTASMGKLLALSLATTLLAAVLFQPALMGKPREVSGARNETANV
ncbi:MMPL family transporter [Bradyrhizobium sp. LHD-71]|uniref:hopanoid transporter HpnN n=1 Tax=Bradyrhizobium sp. LHD-71 TaxID=3072141 RepID=UPI0028107B1F|nr:MMPL family transporter [Bradyrhizobium sp. LHD-71]MDQ8727740.1 MMPL family transporter [Bradyrhizobium sp. LHD-71]